MMVWGHYGVLFMEYLGLINLTKILYYYTVRTGGVLYDCKRMVVAWALSGQVSQLGH